MVMDSLFFFYKFLDEEDLPQVCSGTLDETCSLLDGFRQIHFLIVTQV